MKTRIRDLSFLFAAAPGNRQGRKLRRLRKRRRAGHENKPHVGGRRQRERYQLHDAKKYCENYRGGGYTDWRMPTRDELLTLYDGNATERDMACGFYVKMATDLIQMTCSQFWASDEGVPGSRAAAVHLSDGFPTFFRPSDFLSVRFLPVRRDN